MFSLLVEARFVPITNAFIRRINGGLEGRGIYRKNDKTVRKDGKSGCKRIRIENQIRNERPLADED